jgi:hypothetical protein
VILYIETSAAAKLLVEESGGRLLLDALHLAAALASAPTSS